LPDPNVGAAPKAAPPKPLPVIARPAATEPLAVALNGRRLPLETALIGGQTWVPLVDFCEQIKWRSQFDGEARVVNIWKGEGA
jgi:hypothetical protein